jgi:RNA polymerase sigma-70 factor (ECF subfamily)
MDIMEIKNTRSSRQLPESSFESLIKPHAEQLYRVAYRLTGHAEDAEELVQELFLKLYPRRDELAKVEQLRPWLMRVMYRMFIDQHRRNTRSPLQLVETSDEDDDHPFDRIASHEPGPEADAERADMLERLAQAVDALSEDHRVLVSLHDIEGYTLQELQSVLDCPLGTLKSRLHRARAHLREMLVGWEPDESLERVKNKRAML